MIAPKFDQMMFSRTFADQDTSLWESFGKPKWKNLSNNRNKSVNQSQRAELKKVFKRQIDTSHKFPNSPPGQNFTISQQHRIWSPFEYEHILSSNKLTHVHI